MIASALITGTLGLVSTCLVTGAAGFIGSHLTDRLLDLNIKVIGVDNLSVGKLSHLSHASINPNFNFIECDVNNYQRMLSCIGPEAGIDMVWHLAANSDIHIGDPEIELKNTFLTTFNVIKLMQSLSIYKLAFASSSAIYGELDEMLFEDSGPLHPISNYGAMKLASEACVSAALKSFLERAWIFRFPNVVGPRATHGVIYDLINQLAALPDELEVLGDGLQTKPYVHVSELLNAMLCIVDNGVERLNCVNIGPDGTSTMVREIVGMIMEGAEDVSVRYTGGKSGWSGDVPIYRYSIEKLRRFGCVPKLTSNEAVYKAVNEIGTEITVKLVTGCLR